MQSALLFLAKHTGPKASATPIIVKFMRTYSKDVHKLLAYNGFAPELFGTEVLVGGWIMVVMEYLLGWAMLGEMPPKKRQKYKEKLEAALHIIHDHDFVHGDVRCPNILISGDDINFIDFDHCGQEGEARYLQE